jgi:apolipoprotein N-acyltransferase
MGTRNVLFTISATAASGLLLYFGTGLHPVWWLLWLAPVPVLAIAPRLTRGAAFTIALVAWLIGAANEWDYFRNVLQVPLSLIAIAFFAPAIFFGLGVLFTRSLLRRGLFFIAALSFPAYWVTYEYLTEIGSPHSTFGNLAYTQMNCLPLIQIASITGIWSISFIVFLFAATIAILLSDAGNARQRCALAITVGAIVCAILFFGEFRLNSIPSGQSVAVTVIGKDVPLSAYHGSKEQALALFHEYADEARRDTLPGNDVVVLPEKIARVSERALPEVDALFSTAAIATHSGIVLGLVRQTRDAAFNSSRFYSPDGKLEANYDKHHLIPGVESESPGNKRVLLDQLSGRWGLQICKDMDFPKLSRNYAADGANLLLVPAWDFNVDRWLHARMAVLRAVENDFALARSARNGLLTLADDRGRIVAEAATVPDRFVSITGKLSVGQARTFYTLTGDWFAWLCVTLFVVLLASPFVRSDSEHGNETLQSRW